MQSRNVINTSLTERECHEEAMPTKAYSFTYNPAARIAYDHKTKQGNLQSLHRDLGTNLPKANHYNKNPTQTSLTPIDHCKLDSSYERRLNFIDAVPLTISIG